MAAKRTDIEEYLHGIVANMPDSPGVYQYLDERGTIIYVGKAKNLKRRVSSYFSNPKQTHKTQFLVPKIRDIRYVVVHSEEDALLLENNLIKKYKPRYNVLLKDDKTYPSIALTHEFLPRIFKTRRRNLRGATYFGPYSHVPTMYALLELCQKLYRPRPCHKSFTAEGVREGKYEPCLEYHIKKCGAPCAGRQNYEDYCKNIEGCREILKGNTAEVARQMKEQMLALADELRFEEAEEVKRQYLLLENYRAKSEVVSNTLHNIDVFNIESDEKVAFINYLHVRNGCITQAFTFEYKKKLDETDEELLAFGIVEMRERYASESKEVVVPFPVDLPESYALQTVPQKGDKRKLLELSKLNVKQYRFDRLKQAEKLNPEQRQVRLMKEIQRDLNLPKLPLRIELFDNSNIQGEDAVAACVVFEKLKPSKKDYRKYNIKDGCRPRRLRFDARSRAAPLFAPARRGRSPTRPHHCRRRSRPNGGDSARCGGRIAHRNPHRRPRQRQPPPHPRTALRIPAAERWNEGYFCPFPPAHADAGRGASLRHHLPSRQAQRAPKTLRTRRCERYRRKDKNRS